MQPPTRLLMIGARGHFGREIVKGIDAYCRFHGQWECHLEEDNSPEAVRGAQAAIRRWKADGIIAHIQTRRVAQLVRQSGVPAINVSGVLELAVPSVRTDDLAVGRRIAGHFLDNGFRHFAFVAKAGQANAARRREGFVAQVRAQGFECRVFKNPAAGAGSWVQSRQRLGRWLRWLPRPLAVMCADDLRGQEILWTCAHLGLRVPDEVAVAAVGNEEIVCRMCHPPLSSLDPDPHGIGYEAAKLLHHLIRGGRAPRGPVLVPPRQLVVRASSDVLAAEDPDLVATLRYIRDHADEPISVKDVLRNVPVSRRSLERRFVALLNRTPKAVIRRAHIDRAQRLLAETDLPISTVAHDSGFTSHAKLSICFRRAVGMTPRQYRRSCRGSSVT